MNTENNKIIAEFMGFEMTHKINYVQSGLPNFMKNAEHLQTNNSENLPFHSDWNWLMEVVEKINNTKLENNSFRFIICDRGAEIQRSEYPYGMEEKWINWYKEESLKGAVFFACVEFIKWYNLNKE